VKLPKPVGLSGNAFLARWYRRSDAAMHEDINEDEVAEALGEAEASRSGHRAENGEFTELKWEVAVVSAILAGLCILLFRLAWRAGGWWAAVLGPVFLYNGLVLFATAAVLALCRRRVWIQGRYARHLHVWFAAVVGSWAASAHIHWFVLLYLPVFAYVEHVVWRAASVPPTDVAWLPGRVVVASAAGGVTAGYLLTRLLLGWQ
jgi:hypothetical protein